MYTPRPLELKEIDVLQVLSTMLTETMYSRIFGTAREKGWVYGMGSGSTMLGSTTGWWLGAQVSRTNSQPLVRLIRDECRRLVDGVIDIADFESARTHLVGKTQRSGQTAAGLVGSYGVYYLKDEVRDLNLLTSRLKRMKPQQCIETFQDVCRRGVWGMGVLGSTSMVPAKKLHSYVDEIFTPAR